VAYAQARTHHAGKGTGQTKNVERTWPKE